MQNHQVRTREGYWNPTGTGNHKWRELPSSTPGRWPGPSTASPLSRCSRCAPPELTRREYEVVRFAARGLTDKEIAELLVISVRTVETHVARIFTKVGINDRHRLCDIFA
jgi:DNA-binding NarL/FixJ family response regulator